MKNSKSLLCSVQKKEDQAEILFPCRNTYEIILQGNAGKRTLDQKLPSVRLGWLNQSFSQRIDFQR